MRDVFSLIQVHELCFSNPADFIIFLSLNGQTNHSHPPLQILLPTSTSLGTSLPLCKPREPPKDNSPAARLPNSPRLPNQQRPFSVLPPPHHVNSAPPELVNQLPSAVVFIAATINSTSSTGDPGNWANSARCQARQLVGWSSSSTGRLFLEPPRQEGAFGQSSSQHSSWQTWKPEQRNEEEES